jgi:hypothetical protein
MHHIDILLYYCNVLVLLLPTDKAVFVRPLLYLIVSYLLYVDIFYIQGDEHRYGLLEGK